MHPVSPPVTKKNPSTRETGPSVFFNALNKYRLQARWVGGGCDTWANLGFQIRCSMWQVLIWFAHSVFLCRFKPRPGLQFLAEIPDHSTNIATLVSADHSGLKRL
ncbi:hypothetical protein CEXT_555931 [Caerostris extrusa]|uniref:Uncharacterized protein n=1 Tax=Caerostris extrusa TaxID=172846 RepID=A0AAV4TCM3_CAEEX|nr:hypothetical protein CEXT_555931 [Caerostris extrusa]